MKILILGYSDIVKRKLLPEINSSKDITKIDIASRTIKELENPKPVNKIFNNYLEAIEKSDAEIVYISLPNNLHFEYCISALNNKKNVVVDKPAILNINDTYKIYDAAIQNKVFVTMSCVFNLHNCWVKFNNLIDSSKSNGVLYVDFTIPKLESDNIRLSKKLGGGAFNDMAIYASTAGLLFWNKNAEKVKIHRFDENGLNKGFTVNANYGSGKEMIGNFGFEKDYKNEVRFVGADSSYKYSRVFSPPPDFQTTVYIEEVGNTKIINVGKDNTFRNYLNHITNNFKNKKLLRDEFLRYNLEYEKYITSYEK